MPSYNIADIKAQLSKTTQPKTQTENVGKLPYWKAAFGDHEIRVLPYADSNGQPFQEILFYNKIAEKREISPTTFGLPDPVKEIFEKKRKEGKAGWEIAKNLKPQEKYYAVIIVRSEEDKGPQLWGMSKELRNDFYSTLTHKDNVDEDMFSPETGYDFTITVTQELDSSNKPKTFNGYPVKKIKATPRKKPSKLSKDKAQADAWLAAIPNIEEMYKKFVKSPEALLEVLENYIASLSGATTTVGTQTTLSAPSTAAAEASRAKLAATFASLDKEEEEENLPF